MKTAARIVLTLFALLAGLAALVVLAAWLFGWDWLRAPVENRASAALNRPVAIEGEFDVRWDWDLSPRLILTDVSAGPAQWESTREPLVRIGRLASDVELWPLIFGRLSLNDVRAEGSDLRLYLNASGEANWPRGRSVGGQSLSIDGLTLRDTSVRYRNDRIDLSFEGTLEQFVEEDRAALTGSGTSRGRAYTAELRIGPIVQIFRSLENYPLAATVRSDPLEARFKGNVRPSDDIRLGGQLDLSGTSLDETYAFIGIPAPVTPPFNLSTRLVRTTDSWELREMSGRVGDSDLAGDVMVRREAGSPRFDAELESERLDFDDIGAIIGLPVDVSETSNAELDARSEAFAGSARIFPDAPLAVERISRIDGTLSYSARRVTGFGSDDLGRLDLELELEDQVLQLTPLALDVEPGRLELYSTTDASVSPPASDILILSNDMRLQNLVPNDQVSGRVDGRLELSGTGDSIRATLSNANGRLQAAVDNGQIRSAFVEAIGLDLLSLLATDSNQRQPVCLVTSFRIEDGMAQVDELLAHTDETVIRGTGRINLANETLDLELEANDEQLNLGTIGGPVNVGGTLRDPAIGLGSETALRGLAGVVLGAALSPAAALLATLEVDPPENSACQSTANLAASPPD
ncbi:AsmA family protein [Hyphobacterium sp.]|uniref:AsmA family protein n=1 Tax=Hyphobacterium sp. TaxID=2004662 RepID=UPI003BAB4477